MELSLDTIRLRPPEALIDEYRDQARSQVIAEMAAILTFQHVQDILPGVRDIASQAEDAAAAAQKDVAGARRGEEAAKVRLRKAREKVAARDAKVRAQHYAPVPMLSGGVFDPKTSTFTDSAPRGGPAIQSILGVDRELQALRMSEAECVQALRTARQAHTFAAQQLTTAGRVAGAAKHHLSVYSEMSEPETVALDIVSEFMKGE